jgi:hypothetical protein
MRDPRWLLELVFFIAKHLLFFGDSHARQVASVMLTSRKAARHV